MSSSFVGNPDRIASCYSVLAVLADRPLNEFALQAVLFGESRIILRDGASAHTSGLYRSRLSGFSWRCGADSVLAFGVRSLTFVSFKLRCSFFE